MRLDLSNEAGGRELSENEIDALFRAKEDAVLGCIARARPDEDTYVPGRVTVKFRIQRTGPVKGVQVEAPVILHKGGLTGCIKGVMGTPAVPGLEHEPGDQLPVFVDVADWQTTPVPDRTVEVPLPSSSPAAPRLDSGPPDAVRKSPSDGLTNRPRTARTGGRR